MKHNILVITLIYLINFVNTDLPVHCLIAQIEGDWLIHMSDNHSDNDINCGHKSPDQNLDHYNINIEETFRTKFETIVHLERPFMIQSITGAYIGNWTMIYDEGFELRLADQVFFAFSRYEKVGKFSPSNIDTEDTPGYRNICDKTFLGWYHDSANKNWGCYWAEKIDRQQYELSVIDYNSLFRISRVPKVTGQDMLVMNQGNKNDRRQNELKTMDSSFGNTTNETPESFTFVDFVKSLGWGSNHTTENYLNIPHLDIYCANQGKDAQQNFLEVDAKTFTPDMNFVERINNPNNNYKWTAKVYDDFIGKSYSQMRHLLGNKNTFKNIFTQDTSFLELSVDISLNNKAHKSSFMSNLPKSFDWRSVDNINYDSPIRKQGECGSCYAIAAVSVLESRVRIKTNNRDKPVLSPSSVVSCSRYNQGCAGGYPFLVGKHAKDFGFVEESCQPYSESDGLCHNYCYHQKLYKAKDYG
jgi:hypothetical protein